MAPIPVPVLVPRHLCRVCVIFAPACRIMEHLVHRDMNVALRSGTRTRTAIFQSRLSRLRSIMQNHGMYVHRDMNVAVRSGSRTRTAIFLSRLSRFRSSMQNQGMYVHRDMNVALRSCIRPRPVTFLSRLSRLGSSVQNHGTSRTSRHECRGTSWNSSRLSMLKINPHDLRKSQNLYRHNRTAVSKRQDKADESRKVAAEQPFSKEKNFRYFVPRPCV